MDLWTFGFNCYIQNSLYLSKQYVSVITDTVKYAYHEVPGTCNFALLLSLFAISNKFTTNNKVMGNEYHFAVRVNSL